MSRKQQLLKKAEEESQQNLSKARALLGEKEQQVVNAQEENENVTTLKRHDVTVAAAPQDNRPRTLSGKLKNVPWYPPSKNVRKKLSDIAHDEECSMSQLLTEGLESVFKKRGISIKDLV